MVLMKIRVMLMQLLMLLDHIMQHLSLLYKQIMEHLLCTLLLLMAYDLLVHNILQNLLM